MRRAQAVALASTLAAAPVAAFAQDVDLGAAEYMTSCAQCHGTGGTGDGPLAGFLNTTLPDLTGLQSRNGGVFPVAELYGVIDGSNTSGIHGSSEMPAWGLRYSADAPEQLGFYYTPADEEAFIRGRILALIEFVSTLQAE